MTFKKEPYISLSPEDFTEFGVYSLNDPWVVLLPDGRYRMYVTGLVADPSSPGNYTGAIVSEVTENAFGIGCKGSSGNRPEISWQGAPSVGSTDFKLVLRNGPATGAVILFLGASNTKWDTVALPLDLAILGMTGCELLVSPHVSLRGSATGGNSVASLPIPNDPGLRGANVYAQWFCLDPGSNALGMSASNGVRIEVY